MVSVTAPIVQKRTLAPGIFAYMLHCPSVAAQAEAGQFVHVKVPGFSLRRPISICRIDRQAGTLTLVVEVRGAGTRALSQLGESQSIDLIGPVGKGFALLPAPANAVAVGGGIGTPPLLELAAHYGSRLDAFLGFRSGSAVILEDAFAALGSRVQVATDDGSHGHHGLVTALLADHLKTARPAIIYTCGPRPMIAAVTRLAQEQGIRCQVSLEEHMACGVGACLGCACRMMQDTPEGSPQYRHVCKDGPVFEAHEVDLTPR